MKKNCKLCKKEFDVNSNRQIICNNCKKKKCLYCKKEFNLSKPDKKHKGRYCSIDCYLKNRFGTGKCKFCGKSSKYAYCSDRCRKDYWNKNEYKLLKKKRLWERKLEIIKKLGGKCVKCSNSDIRCLDINHIDRNKKKRPKNKTYTWQYRLKEWSANMDNLELLCANCHRIHTYKQMKYGKY